MALHHTFIGKATISILSNISPVENLEYTDMYSEENVRHLKTSLSRDITKMISVHFLPWLLQGLPRKCISIAYTHILQKLYNKAGSYGGFLSCVSVVLSEGTFIQPMIQETQGSDLKHRF